LRLAAVCLLRRPSGLLNFRNILTIVKFLLAGGSLGVARLICLLTAGLSRILSGACLLARRLTGLLPAVLLPRRDI
jgi:hypothetical protein